MEALLDDHGTLAPVSDHVAPTWIGAIPTLMETPLGVTLRARTDVRLATIAPGCVRRADPRPPAGARRVLAQVRPVIGRITQLEQNQERLASLGTMAAGLAHELNNPATAARRAADDLAKALEVLSSTIGSFVESGLERAEAARLVDAAAPGAGRRRPTRPRRARRAPTPATNCPTAWPRRGWASTGSWSSRWPPPASTESSWIRSKRSPAPPPRPPLRWIAASLSARQLAAELTESTERMTKLVTAIKTYAYMDRGEIVQADLRDGLESTVTILGHKLKHTDIMVKRDYDPVAGQAHRSRRRAQPGVDQPAGQRDRGARRRGAHQRSPRAPTATAPRSTSPMTAREFPTTSATACSTRSSPPRMSARAPAWGWIRRDGSSSSATTAV